MTPFGSRKVPPFISNRAFDGSMRDIKADRPLFNALDSLSKEQLRACLTASDLVPVGGAAE